MHSYSKHWIILALVLAFQPVWAQIPDTLTLTLPAPAGSPVQVGARLGRSVVMNDTYAAVGATYDDVRSLDSGAVKIFAVSTGALLHVIPSVIGGSGDQFGTSLAMSGSLLVVGTPFANVSGSDTGIAHVYDLSSGTPILRATLRNPSPFSNDRFATSVAISGNRVAVGVPEDDTGSSSSGIVYLFELTGSTSPTPVATIENPDPAAFDRFGFSMAMSGSTLVVGVYGDDTGGSSAGSAYVYDLDGATPSVPIQTLNNPAPTSGDEFGYAVALSGNQLVVGVRGDDPGASSAGSAHVYDLGGATPTVPVLTLDNPTPAAGDRFGAVVAVDGTRVVVGTFDDDTGASGAGSAYVYDIGGATPTTPIAELNNPTPDISDNFGYAVAIGGMRVLVGAPNDDTAGYDTGSAYMYEIAGATPTVPVLTLVDPGPPGGDRFGQSVAISGSRIVVGAYLNDLDALDTGRAYVFDLAGSTPSVPEVVLSIPSPTILDQFGVSVAISGSLAVVGAPAEDTGGSSAGSVYVFDVNGATPSVPILTVNNPEPNSGDFFGSAVALSGTRLVVGADNDDTGATNTGIVYVFDLAGATPGVPTHVLANPTPAPSELFGDVVAVSGDRVVVGVPNDSEMGSGSGAVYVYDLSGVSPTDPVVTLFHPTPSTADRFGAAVAINGSKVVVGTPSDDDGGITTGTAHVFDVAGATPTEPVATLHNPTPASGDFFGDGVAISGDIVVVGAVGDDIAGSSTGRAFIFDLAAPAPTIPVSILDNPNPSSGDSLGREIAISGDTLVLGVPLDDDGVSVDQGIVYVFSPEVPAPEIAVFEGSSSGVELADNASPGRDFGAVSLGGTGATQTFTIQNTGTLDLTGISVDSSNGAEFAVAGPGANSLVPNATTTFTVTFNPLLSGPRSGVISIASNDENENPFRIQVEGTGAPLGQVIDIFPYAGAAETFVVPEGVTSIFVEAWGAQGMSNAQGVTGGLGGFASGHLAVTPGQVLTIQVGGGGGASAIGGYNGGGDAGDSPSLVCIGGGGGGASDIRMEPAGLSERVIVAAGGGGAGGNRVEDLGRGTGGGGGGGYYGGGGGAAWPGSTPGPVPTGGTQSAGGAGGDSTITTVAGNDGSPGQFGMGGQGGREGAGLQSGSEVADEGGAGGGLVGADGIHTGSLTGQSGAGGSSYLGGVTSGLSTPGVRFGDGLVKLTYSLPGDFPEIVVYDGTTSDVALIDGATPGLDFGNVGVGEGSSTRTFTIQNVGQADLTGISVVSSNDAEFTVAGPSATSLAQNGEATFTVSFSPLSIGLHSSVISIASNDGDENPFDIHVQGFGADNLAVAFYEDFEGPGFTHPSWLIASPTYTVTFPTDGMAPAGSAYGSVAGSDSSKHRTGPGASFAPTQPKYVSWRARTPDINSTGYFVLSNSGITVNESMVFCYFKAGAGLNFFTDSRTYVHPDTQPNTWYTIELKNVDWVAKTFDIWIDGVEVETAFPFRSPWLTQLTRVYLYNFGSGTGEYDEIILKETPRFPEIAVEQPVGRDLTSGTAEIDFGIIEPGFSSGPLSVTVRNDGDANLTLGLVSPTGPHAGDFLVNTAGMRTDLASGQTTSFTVAYTPTVARASRAILHIGNNDGDENPFEIILKGTDGTPGVMVTREIAATDGTGAQVDGEPPGTTYVGFVGAFAVNETGLVAGTTVIQDGAGERRRAVVVGEPPQVLARDGDDMGALGLPAGTVAYNFRDPLINDEGHVAYIGDVRGAVVGGEQRALFTTVPDGVIKLVMRQGDADPTTGTSFRLPMALSLAGQSVIFLAQTDDFRTGLYAWDNTNGLSLLARTGGSVMAGGSSKTIQQIIGLQTNAASSGQSEEHVKTAGDDVRISVMLRFTDTTEGVLKGGFNQATSTYSGFGSTYVENGRLADAHAGASAVIPGARMRSFISPGWDQGGTFYGLVSYMLRNVGGVTQYSDSGVFVDLSPGELVMQVREGEVAPGTGGFIFKDFYDVMVGAGDWEFLVKADVRGPGILGENNEGLWAKHMTNGLQLVARAGDEPPGVPGGQFRVFVRHALPGNGAPFFGATLVTGVGGVTDANDAGVWAMNSLGELRKVIQEGDVINVGGLDRTVQTILSLENNSSGAIGSRIYTSDGSMKLLVKFTDGLQAMVDVAVP